MQSQNPITIKVNDIPKIAEDISTNLATHRRHNSHLYYIYTRQQEPFESLCYPCGERNRLFTSRDGMRLRSLRSLRFRAASFFFFHPIRVLSCVYIIPILSLYVFGCDARQVFRHLGIYYDGSIGCVSDENDNDDEAFLRCRYMRCPLCTELECRDFASLWELKSARFFRWVYI